MPTVEDALTAIRAAKAHYQPGGAFGKGIEAGLERGRVKTVSHGMQSLVSAGLAGTTMAAGLGGKYEEEVAAPTRLRVEEQRAQALSGIDVVYASMLYRIAEAEKQRKFQAKEAKSARATQFAMARPARGTKFMESAAAPGDQFPSQERFPSLYGAGVSDLPSIPDWMGGGGVSDLPSTPVGARVSGYKPGTTFGPSLRTPTSDFGPPTSYYGKSGMTDPWLVGPR